IWLSGPLLCWSAESVQRVQPPEWSRDVLDEFFEDAREQLVGERPASAAGGEQRPSVATPASGEGEAEEAEFRWSLLIEADTLTAEIKRINNQLGTALRKSSSFQGGGNLLCRRDFGLLSVLFAVIRDFDKDVRWKRSARQVQAECYQASNNCKSASAQSFAAAQNTHALLEDLFRGQAPAATGTSEDEQLLIERPQLMQSMELSLKERLGPAVANSREFRRRSQQAVEQAQVLAVLAEMIQREGYEYADDDTFLDEARQLREAAAELSQAAKEKNYEAARAAAGKVGQSCSRCHEGYRG
ncbi:MAG: cytochrome c, partial [Bythopirellula sp.]